MTRFKLTPVGKFVLFVFIALIVFGGVFYFKGDSIKSQVGSKIPQLASSSTTKSNGSINISLDQWVGWKPIIDANGGLTTKPDSIYGKMGLNLTIHIIDEADQSSNALIKGDLDAAGYTVNRFAFLYPKFKENKVDVVMPFVTNSSTGGDGIIAKKDINKVEDLVGKKIAVPRFSEAQTLVLWLLNKSDLNDQQKKQIQQNMVLVDTPDDAAKAFFAGQVDAAATWQPFLSQASDPNSNAHVLFSTKSATNIVLDGLVFRKDFYDKNKEMVSKLIEGALQAAKLYKGNPGPIKASMSQMADASDKDIADMTDDATLSDYGTNLKLLSKDGLASTLFTDMSNIWKSLGEKAIAEDANKVFDTSALEMLKGKFDTTTNNTPKFTEEQRNSVKDKPALLSKKVSIQFKVDSDEFTDKEAAYKALNELVGPAKIADGMILQIEGNTSSDGDPQLNKELSYKRAKAVSSYLKMQGVDPSRFLVVGNGDSKPIGDNNTQAGKDANRRTDIFFKPVNQ